MSGTQRYQKAIADKLAYMESQIKRYGEIRLLDENTAMEDVVCELLNIMYGYHLQNLNRKKENFPGIDLGDETSRVAVQVTSNTSRNKVSETIKKFEQHGCAKQYDKLIVFILGTRSNFQKEFSTNTVQFTAEDNIMDFTTLTKRLKELDLQTLKRVHDYLEGEYPGTISAGKWVKRLCFCLGTVAVLALLLSAALILRNEYLESHPEYAYETNMDWLKMSEAASVLGASSRVTVYKDDEAYFEPNTYWYGAGLVVVYNNLDKQDRVITKFHVYAEDIVEDYSPMIEAAVYNFDDPLTFDVRNNGWGATGPIQVSLVRFYPYNSGDEKIVELSLREGTADSWAFDSIEPGGYASLPLFSTDNVQVLRHQDFEECIWYVVEVELVAPESGYRKTMEWWLEVYPDHVEIMRVGGNGDDSDSGYIIFVETSEPSWSESYDVYQLLPGKQAVRLPIFIVPEMSCTMSIRIEFETQDGEIIQAEPLKNAKFVIPYIENDYFEYVDGKLLDWSQVEGKEIVYFPFAATPYIIPEEMLNK